MSEKEYKKLLKDKFIIYRSSLNLPMNFTFGVEIEYENIVKDMVSYLLSEEQEQKRLLSWENKSEFDIAFYNRNGEEENGEITSPILKDNIKAWKNLRYALNLLKENNAIVTEKCGGHVNIGSHILENNNEYWRNFFLLWILYEKEIYKFSRGEFKTLRPDKKGFFMKVSSNLDLDEILSIDSELYLNNLTNRLLNKSFAIYVNPKILNKRAKDNRIEFRIPNGTLSEEVWQNNINFFSKFLLACKKELDVEKVLYKIKNKEHSIVELANYIFSSDIDKNNFLIQALKTNKVYKKELPKHTDFIIYN